MTDAKAPCSPGRIFVLLRLLSGGPCGARSERGRSAESGQRPDSVPAETRRDASNAGSLSIRGGLQRLQQLAAARLQYWPKADFGKISTLTYLLTGHGFFHHMRWKFEGVFSRPVWTKVATTNLPRPSRALY